MVYAAIYGPRQIVGAGILAIPIILMAWGWIRLILRRASDPPMVSWIPSVIFLVFMSIGYGLTLAEIFNETISRYLFSLWHTEDAFIYLLISFLACLFAWKGRGPIRWQVFSTGLLLTVLYLAMGWSMMD